MYIFEEKVKKLTKEYIEMFPADYRDVVQAVKDNREQLKDPKFAGVKGSDSLDRHLVEYPTALYSAFMRHLNEEESASFLTKEGQRWFAKTYSEFTIPEDI